MEYPLLWNLNKLQFFPSYHAIEKFFTAHFLNENVDSPFARSRCALLHGHD